MPNTASNIAKEIHDQYYTPVETCEWVFNLLRTEANWDFRGIVMEPCVGRGNFVHAAQNLGLNLNWLTNDLFPAPEYKPDTEVDILKLDPNPRPDFIVTNPPFGNANILARKGLHHCLNVCDRVAMVLPKGARRIGFLDSQPEFAHLTLDLNLPEMTYELSNGERRKVKTCLQVWEVDRTRKRQNIRDTLDLRRDFLNYWDSGRPDFAFSEKYGEFQFQVYRWGGSRMNEIRFPTDGESEKRRGSWLSVAPSEGFTVEEVVSVIQAVDVSDYLERSTSLAAFDPVVWLSRVNEEAVRRGLIPAPVTGS